MYRRVLPRLQLTSLQQEIKSSPCSEHTLDGGQKPWGALSSGTQPLPCLEPTSTASGSPCTQALLPLQFSLSWDFHQTLIFSLSCLHRWWNIQTCLEHPPWLFSSFSFALKRNKTKLLPPPKTNPLSSFLSRQKKTQNKQRNNCLPSSLLKPSGAVWR